MSRGQLISVGVGVLLLFSAFIIPPNTVPWEIPLVLGLLVIAFTLIIYVDSLPIPDVDLSEVPWSLMIQHPEWRNRTFNNRVLNGLQSKYDHHVALLEIEWEYLIKARQVFEHKNRGYLEYLKKRAFYPRALRGFREAHSNMEAINIRVQTILAGDVEQELYELEGAKQHILLEKAERQAELSEVANLLRTERDADKRRQLEKREKKLKNLISSADREIIEIGIAEKKLKKLESKAPRKEIRQCLKCGRAYTDESLNFCLDDGSPLAIDGEVVTVVRPAQGGVRSEPTSNLSVEQLIQKVKTIETLLVDGFGADGRGLHEKLSSVETIIPSHLTRKIRHIATVRNKLVHEAGFVFDQDSKILLLDCDYAIESLKILIGDRPSRD